MVSRSAILFSSSAILSLLAWDDDVDDEWVLFELEDLTSSLT